MRCSVWTTALGAAAGRRPVAVIALAGLLIAGSRHLAVRTASADAPNQLTIATLRPGQTVCEGPITSQGPARSVGVWGSAAGRSGTG